MGAAEGYNGWTNYETWAVNLWMSNDEHSYRAWQSLARELVQEHANDDPVAAMAMAIKGELIDGIPEDLSGLYSDLLGGALGEVDYHEIAEDWISGVSKESK